MVVQQLAGIDANLHHVANILYHGGDWAGADEKRDEAVADGELRVVHERAHHDIILLPGWGYKCG